MPTWLGEVVEIGSAVEGHRIGDVVWADLFDAGHGAIAEFVCVRATSLRHKPDRLDDTAAATLPHSGLLALQSHRRGRIQRGESVLINGAGGCVGQFAIQIAKARGAVVVGVDRTEKLAFMRQLGADDVVDHTTTDITREDERFDVILDIAATRSPLAFRRIVDDGGRYVHVARSMAGFLRAAASGAVTSRLRTSRISNFPWKANASDDLAEIVELVELGGVVPTIDSTDELAELPKALQRHAVGDARGKILISIGDG